MICVSCSKEIPEDSRFCNFCGMEQLSAAPKAVEPNGHVLVRTVIPPLGQFDLLEREATVDYESQRRFEGISAQLMGCLGWVGIVLVSIIAIIPGVPLMALFGIPGGLILGLLTFFNFKNLQEKIKGVGLLQKIPGFSGGRLSLSLSVFIYLALLSGICIVLLRMTGSAPR